MERSHFAAHVCILVGTSFQKPHDAAISSHSKVRAQPLQNLVEPWCNPGGTLPQTTPDHPAAGGTLVEPGGTLPGPPRSLRRTWWNPAETLVEPYLHPAALAEPGGGTLVEPYLKPPRTTPQPSQNLVEPCWNPGGTLPRSPRRTWWNPGGILVEPYLKPPRTTRTTPQPSQNLVEPCWNPGGTLPQTIPDHPAPSQNLVEPCWNPGGTLVEPLWNLASGPPRMRPQSFQLLGKKHF